MEKKPYNKIEYNQEYNKNHYKAFKAELKREDSKKLELLLKSNGFNKAEFLRKATVLLEKGYFVDKYLK